MLPVIIPLLIVASVFVVFRVIRGKLGSAARDPHPATAEETRPLLAIPDPYVTPAATSDLPSHAEPLVAPKGLAPDPVGVAGSVPESSPEDPRNASKVPVASASPTEQSVIAPPDLAEIAVVSSSDKDAKPRSAPPLTATAPAPDQLGRTDTSSGPSPQPPEAHSVPAPSTSVVTEAPIANVPRSAPQASPDGVNDSGTPVSDIAERSGIALQIASELSVHTPSDLADPSGTAGSSPGPARHTSDNVSAVHSDSASTAHVEPEAPAVPVPTSPLNEFGSASVDAIPSAISAADDVVHSHIPHVAREAALAPQPGHVDTGGDLSPRTIEDADSALGNTSVDVAEPSDFEARDMETSVEDTETSAATTQTADVAPSLVVVLPTKSDSAPDPAVEVTTPHNTPIADDDTAVDIDMTAAVAAAAGASAILAMVTASGDLEESPDGDGAVEEAVVSTMQDADVLDGVEAGQDDDGPAERALDALEETVSAVVEEEKDLGISEGDPTPVESSAGGEGFVTAVDTTSSELGESGAVAVESGALLNEPTASPQSDHHASVTDTLPKGDTNPPEGSDVLAEPEGTKSNVVEASVVSEEADSTVVYSDMKPAPDVDRDITADVAVEPCGADVSRVEFVADEGPTESLQHEVLVSGDETVAVVDGDIKIQSTDDADAPQDNLTEQELGASVEVVTETTHIPADTSISASKSQIEHADTSHVSGDDPVVSEAELAPLTTNTGDILEEPAVSPDVVESATEDVKDIAEAGTAIVRERGVLEEMVEVTIDDVPATPSVDEASQEFQALVQDAPTDVAHDIMPVASGNNVSVPESKEAVQFENVSPGQHEVGVNESELDTSTEAVTEDTVSASQMTDPVAGLPGLAEADHGRAQSEGSAMLEAIPAPCTDPEELPVPATDSTLTSLIDTDVLSEAKVATDLGPTTQDEMGSGTAEAGKPIAISEEADAAIPGLELPSGADHASGDVVAQLDSVEAPPNDQNVIRDLPVNSPEEKSATSNDTGALETSEQATRAIGEDFLPVPPMLDASQQEIPVSIEENVSNSEDIAHVVEVDEDLLELDAEKVEALAPEDNRDEAKEMTAVSEVVSSVKEIETAPEEENMKSEGFTLAGVEGGASLDRTSTSQREETITSELEGEIPLDTEDPEDVAECIAGRTTVTLEPVASTLEKVVTSHEEHGLQENIMSLEPTTVEEVDLKGSVLEIAEEEPLPSEGMTMPDVVGAVTEISEPAPEVLEDSQLATDAALVEATDTIISETVEAEEANVVSPIAKDPISGITENITQTHEDNWAEGTTTEVEIGVPISEGVESEEINTTTEEKYSALETSDIAQTGEDISFAVDTSVEVESDVPNSDAVVEEATVTAAAESHTLKTPEDVSIETDTVAEVETDVLTPKDVESEARHSAFETSEEISQTHEDIPVEGTTLKVETNLVIASGESKEETVTTEVEDSPFESPEAVAPTQEDYSDGVDTGTEVKTDANDDEDVLVQDATTENETDAMTSEHVAEQVNATIETKDPELETSEVATQTQGVCETETLLAAVDVADEPPATDIVYTATLEGHDTALESGGNITDIPLDGADASTDIKSGSDIGVVGTDTSVNEDLTPDRVMENPIDDATSPVATDVVEAVGGEVSKYEGEHIAQDDSLDTKLPVDISEEIVGGEEKNNAETGEPTQALMGTCDIDIAAKVPHAAADDESAEVAHQADSGLNSPGAPTATTAASTAVALDPVTDDICAGLAAEDDRVFDPSSRISNIPQNADIGIDQKGAPSGGNTFSDTDALTGEHTSGVLGVSEAVVAHQEHAEDLDGGHVDSKEENVYTPAVPVFYGELGDGEKEAITEAKSVPDHSEDVNAARITRDAADLFGPSLQMSQESIVRPSTDVRNALSSEMVYIEVSESDANQDNISGTATEANPDVHSSMVAQRGDLPIDSSDITETVLRASNQSSPSATSPAAMHREDSAVIEQPTTDIPPSASNMILSEQTVAAAEADDGNDTSAALLHDEKYVMSDDVLLEAEALIDAQQEALPVISETADNIPTGDIVAQEPSEVNESTTTDTVIDNYSIDEAVREIPVTSTAPLELVSIPEQPEAVSVDTNVVEDASTLQESTPNVLEEISGGISSEPVTDAIPDVQQIDESLRTTEMDAGSKLLKEETTSEQENIDVGAQETAMKKAEATEDRSESSHSYFVAPSSVEAEPSESISNVGEGYVPLIDEVAGNVCEDLSETTATTKAEDEGRSFDVGTQLMYAASGGSPQMDVVPPETRDKVDCDQAETSEIVQKPARVALQEDVEPERTDNICDERSLTAEQPIEEPKEPLKVMENDQDRQAETSHMEEEQVRVLSDTPLAYLEAAGLLLSSTAPEGKSTVVEKAEQGLSPTAFNEDAAQMAREEELVDGKGVGEERSLADISEVLAEHTPTQEPEKEGETFVGSTGQALVQPVERTGEYIGVDSSGIVDISALEDKPYELIVLDTEDAMETFANNDGSEDVNAVGAGEIVISSTTPVKDHTVEELRDVTESSSEVLASGDTMEIEEKE